MLFLEFIKITTNLQQCLLIYFSVVFKVQFLQLYRLSEELLVIICLYSTMPKGDNYGRWDPPVLERSIKAVDTVMFI